MAFQTPITIRRALDSIARDDYLLPAIQREVVWQRGQIVRLFDSLMQGYPIGSFLFWKVDPEHSRDFTFYEFMTHYHQRTSRHLVRHDLMGTKPLTGVLDGQQRLTALNIGLRGSHAEKLPKLWWTSPGAFPERHLYLGLDGEAASNEMGTRYAFQFLDKQQLADRVAQGEHWFRVSDILAMQTPYEVMSEIQQRGLAAEAFPMRALSRLHEVVHVLPVINYYLEESQDLDKVLNIFIRVNSGGTVLSYSDLLLSIATAQWKDVDAREVIHRLVDELNETGQGFAFSKDLVLKAGLVLTDIPSIAFRVTNFNVVNMKTLETHWEAIARALRLAVRLLADFGFSGRTLTADSVIIPVAYYLHRRKADESFLTLSAMRDDREHIRGWVVRSLLKPGVWGSGLDQLLLALRTAIRDHDGLQFPVEDLEATMAQRGKGLRFGAEEVQDLVGMVSSDRRVFPLLSLLYPGMDFRHEFHIDHIFPRSRFTPARLRAAGVAEDALDAFAAAVDRLPNLQLLEGPFNVAKKDVYPTLWMTKHYPDAGARDAYRSRHHLGDIPEDITGFMTFYEARRDRMAQRLRGVLGLTDA